MPANQIRQTFFILVLCVAVVTGVYFYVYGIDFSMKTKIFSEAPVSVTAKVNSVDPIITNEDWKKQFLDTSKTSTSNTAFKAVNTTSNTKVAPLSITDKVSQDFFTKYAELRQSGLNTDEKAVASVMGQVVANNISGLASTVTYTTKDIKIISDSPAALSNYGTLLLKIFQSYTPRQGAAEIANTALLEQNMSKLKEIDPIINGYKQTLSALLALSVPKSLVTYHLDLLGGVNMAMSNAKSFRNIDTDPISGLAAASLEMVAMQKIATSVYAINQFFIKSGIKIGV